jgi:hypothetical protein
VATRLEPVTPANRDAVCAVEVRDRPGRFDTPSTADFLDEAPLHPTFTPNAVVEDGLGGPVVGFVSAGPLPEQRSRWWVPLLW